jgi:hypothetical protein
VSRSTAATNDEWDFSKARFQAELLRVTDPRSNKDCSLLSFAANSTAAFRVKICKSIITVDLSSFAGQTVELRLSQRVLVSKRIAGYAY